MDWRERHRLELEAQYQKNLDKNIQKGGFVRVQTGARSVDGLSKVVAVSIMNRTIHVTVRRLVKPDGVIVLNSKTTNILSAEYLQPVTPDSVYEEAIKRANDVREHMIKAGINR